MRRAGGGNSHCFSLKSYTEIVISEIRTSKKEKNGNLHRYDFHQQLHFDDCSRRHPRCFSLTTINLQNQTTLAET